MTNLIAPILILQAFCLYHIYSRRSEKYWYLIILFFPVFGAIAYFIIHFYNKRNIQAVNEVAGHVTDTNYELKELEIETEFADTVSNKIRLSDEYMKNEDYSKAVEVLESCISKLTIDDEELNEKLLVAYYKDANYLDAIQIGNRLNKEKYFQNSMEKAYYAWSYFELHDDAKAEALFQEANIPNTNYYQRKEFAKFLIEINKNEEAQELIGEALEEISAMDVYEKRLIKDIIDEIKKLKA